MQALDEALFDGVSASGVHPVTPARRGRRVAPSTSVTPDLESLDLALTSAGSSGGDHDCACLVCLRIFNKSQDFFDLNTLCQQSVSGPRYCDSCFTIWRTVYHGKTSLTEYGSWIQLSEDHRAEAILRLLAFLMLKQECLFLPARACLIH